MTPTQRLANILNTVFHLTCVAKFIPPNIALIHKQMMEQLDDDIQWMHQQGQARRAVSMCLIFMARHDFNRRYADIRNIYWQQWTQKYQTEMRNLELFEDYHNRVSEIMFSMRQNAITEQRALQFAIAA